MGLSQHGFLVLSWSLASFLLVAMAAFAMIMGYLYRRKLHTQESFITARGQVGRVVVVCVCVRGRKS